MTTLVKSDVAHRLTPFLARLPVDRFAEVTYRRVDHRREVLEVEGMSVMVDILQDPYYPYENQNPYRKITLSAAGTLLRSFCIDVEKVEKEEAVLLLIRGYFAKIQSLTKRPK